MESKSSLYEVRKSIRFEIIPQFKNMSKILRSTDLEKDLQNFISKYEKLLINFSDIVFDFSKEKLNIKLKIKFSFLKTYTKIEYYDNKIELLRKGNNQIEMGYSKKFEYLFEKFKAFGENNIYFLEQIKKNGCRKEENKSRKSDLAYWFHQISRRTNFEFIKELFNENINIEGNLCKRIEETKKIIHDLQELILKIEKNLLPSQSMGQVIEKASFNYYTVNKKPKDYDQKIREKENEKNKLLKEFKPILSIEDSGFKNYILEYADKPTNLKIEKAYTLMKEYKAKQKSNFLEYLNFQLRGEKSDLEISLFDDILDKKNKEKFETILLLSQAILLLSQAKTDIINLKKTINKEEKNKEINENIEKYNILYGTNFGKVEKESFLDTITKLKIKRGEYFFEGNKEGKFAFLKYGKFCNEYKKVALQYGKIKATIKSIEREKIDAEKIDSWAFILENDDNKFLLTIPRKKVFYAKKYLDDIKNEKGNLVLYKFESLTLRALNKLCFGKENNTFDPNIAKDLYYKNNNFVNKKDKNGIFFYNLKRKDEIGDKEDLEKNNENLLLFYKTVLNLESTQKQIVIKYFTGFNEFIKSNFENLDDFEQKLKKVCYVKQKIIISEETKEKIINDFDAKLYKITSYDLEKNDKDVLSKLKYKDKLDRNNPNNHTYIWWNFWEENNEKINFPIRLNPEVRISFVEKKEDFIQTHSELPFNRKFNDRFLLTTSFTENALNKGIDLNFKETDEIIVFYHDYNKKFNNENRQNLKYFYGLDRGEKELVSLGVFDMSQEKNEEKGVKIKIYELKEEFFEKADEMGRFPYKNISYFTDEKYSHYFKEEEVSCIDLTKAKLIKGKIYINGDLSTYENLKKVSEDRKDNQISIENINHLRDAICANMVGIIAFLQKKYTGMIFFEDMKTKSKNHLFEKNNTTLGSKIEEKILQKFSSLNQVPPSYKQIFTLQDDKKIHQLGIVGYVKIGGTSTNCPKCQKKLYGHGKGPDFENSMHHYKENNGVDYGDSLEEAKKTRNDNCNYHMKNNNYGLSFINSGDDLATYNIAKKGLEYINSFDKTI